MPGSSRLIVVSNRLPVRMEAADGELQVFDSSGGLASTIRSLQGEMKMLWLGWPGLSIDDPQTQARISQVLKNDHGCSPVFIPQALFERYYNGFSNGLLWPLFHYLPQYAHFQQQDWEAYQQVNRLFAEQVIAVAAPGDTIWIHDYHLLLVPGLIRQALPEARIGFFLHIPFPSYEIYRTLPWRLELLQGLVGADLIGFHSYGYARHLHSSLLRLMGLENVFGKVEVEDRILRIEIFPLGIDVDHFASAVSNPAVQREIARISQAAEGGKVILSVDRLDFTKGIVDRLLAYELFLELHPQWHGKVTLISLIVPSRTEISGYQQLKRQVDEIIGRINGRFTRTGWTPVWYLYRSVPFDELAALYQRSDVALVTPLRDGMNLVAKEYLASHPDGSGVLILSETAGAARELGEALVVNPFDQLSLVAAMRTALEMPLSEQRQRNLPMLERLRRYDNRFWARDFLGQLERAVSNRGDRRVKKLSSQRMTRLEEAYLKSQRRLLFLDYDGTLVGFSNEPEEAVPDGELLALVDGLAACPENTVVIISGRDQQFLERWMGSSGADLAAEHGAKYRRANASSWQAAPLADPAGWKGKIRHLMETHADRTPGAFVEEKDYALAWHYRRSEPELGTLRGRELLTELESYVANTPLIVMYSNKVIEVKDSGTSKGHAAQRWLSELQPVDFVLAMGDDVTDEDLFFALPPESWSIKVGTAGHSHARFYIQSVDEARQLLRRLLSLEGDPQA